MEIIELTLIYPNVNSLFWQTCLKTLANRHSRFSCKTCPDLCSRMRHIGRGKLKNSTYFQKLSYLLKTMMHVFWFRQILLLKERLSKKPFRFLKLTNLWLCHYCPALHWPCSLSQGILRINKIYHPVCGLLTSCLSSYVQATSGMFIVTHSWWRRSVGGTQGHWPASAPPCSWTGRLCLLSAQNTAAWIQRLRG